MPETLKNLLLVMATAGAFDADRGGTGAAGGEQSLAEMTKAVICSWGVPEVDLAQLWEEAVGSRLASAPTPPVAAAS